MKKVTLLLICALGTAVLVTGCKKKNASASPGEMAKQHHENLMNQDYESYANCIFYEEFLLPEEVQAPGEDKVVQVQKMKESNVKALKETAHPVIQEKGGIKEVAVRSETVAPDGKTADVVLVSVYHNGEIEHLDYHMIMDEGDQLWKVKMGPHKEVWKVHTADGKRESFKLKDFENKDVAKIHDDGDRDFIKEKDGDRKDVLKVKVDGEKEVVKVIEQKDETIIKEKVDGKKEVTRIKKDEAK